MRVFLTSGDVSSKCENQRSFFWSLFILDFWNAPAQLFLKVVQPILLEFSMPVISDGCPVYTSAALQPSYFWKLSSLHFWGSPAQLFQPTLLGFSSPVIFERNPSYIFWSSPAELFLKAVQPTLLAFSSAVISDGYTLCMWCFMVGCTYFYAYFLRQMQAQTSIYYTWFL